MKPLLDIHRTPEDRAIWLRMADRYIREPGAFGVTSCIYRDSDRRDASMMLSFVRFRGLSQSHEQWHIRLSSIGIPLEELWGYA